MKGENTEEMAAMNRKERFFTALSGGTPDKVPSVPKIYVGLAASLTGREIGKVLQDPQDVLLALIEAGRLAKADAVRQFQFPRRKLQTIQNTLCEVNNDNEVIGVVDVEGGYATHLENSCSFHLSDERCIAFNHFWISKGHFVQSLEDVNCMIVPKKEFYVDYGCADIQKKVMDQAECLGLIGDCDSATMAFLTTMRGMNQAMLDLYDNPRLVHSIMRKGVEIAVERGKFNIDAGLHILRINDSVGNMSVISPEKWREFVFPYMKELCSELHRYSPETKIYCHICGNVLPIIEDLMETGLDCIAPLDPLGGFSPGQIRKIAGDAYPLMGGVNTMSFIQKNTEEIIKEARECVLQAGQQGAYILGSGCVVPRQASLESLLALHKSRNMYGVYHPDNEKLMETI